jgi:hypothetical protein
MAVRFQIDKTRIPSEKLDDPRLSMLEEEASACWVDDSYRLRICRTMQAGEVLERATIREIDSAQGVPYSADSWETTTGLLFYFTELPRLIKNA